MEPRENHGHNKTDHPHSIVPVLSDNTPLIVDISTLRHPDRTRWPMTKLSNKRTLSTKNVDIFLIRCITYVRRVCVFSYIFILPYSLSSINHLRNPSVTTTVVCVVGSSGRPDRCAGATRLLTVRFNRYHPDDDLPVSRFATI